ncbi:Amidohydrolase family protein [Trichophyton interdigitale]|uniref:Amidohydrolase family protein n=2 Tax=Trichophyton interdigitale TaxID=101480 RepID=A0A9P5CVZ0_9EURO|nr:hypothetical protein H101_04732 [Trichophyton interdigitale H6]KAF3892907.1 Amidohydrolase family protein [Trichophyton interdigitale]KAF3897868.1 Amidohydrolase family protein [Trichophyton interdigitale]KAG8212007.1 Amidohydrolase family protein [Trichophyton interdigitale]KDB23177.1 hypothetical protein H109_04932 [Trichophyton interdigitale MR816]
MRPSGGKGSRSTLLLCLLFICLALFAGHTMAQDDKNPAPGNSPPQPPNNAPPPPEKTDNPPNTPASNPAPAPTDNKPKDDNKPGNTDNAPSPSPPPPASTDDKKPSETANLPPLGSSTESEPSTTQESQSSTPISIPSNSDSDSGPGFSLPTLTGIPQIPTATIPPKKNAPYLQHSNLPEGTVFIGVGAGLGLIFVAVFAWRALVAWSINRSVRRAATAHQTDSAAALLNPSKRKSKAYRQSTGGSMSLEKLHSGNASSNRHSALHRKSQPPNSSLFFSPTAGASNLHAAGNRASGYLPAGYYAASGAAPGSGAGLQHSTSSIGLAPLGPQSQGYSRTRSTGPTPPDSPALSPNARRYEQTHPSTSSVNLSSPPQGRAPSAYLEDLFENHPSGPQR